MTSLYERFRKFLEIEAPELLKLTADVGNKFDTRFDINDSENNFKIEIGIDELLIVFGGYHEHFGYPDEAESDTFQEVLQVCSGIISEKYVLVYSYDHEDHLTGTLMTELNKDYTVPIGGKIKVRSFRGTYNS